MGEPACRLAEREAGDRECGKPEGAGEQQAAAIDVHGVDTPFRRKACPENLAGS
jgi:hypothetical protein